MAIQITQALGILHMTIERADRRNTITSDMFRTMTDALLDAAVDLGDQVVAVRLGLDAQLLTRVQGEGCRLADRSHPVGEQVLQAGRRRRPL